MIRKTLKAKKVKIGVILFMQKKVNNTARNVSAIIFILLIIEIIMLQTPLKEQ